MELYIGEHQRDKNLKKQNYSENLALEEIPAYVYNSDIGNAEYMLLSKLEVRVAASHDTAVSDEYPVSMLTFRCVVNG